MKINFNYIYPKIKTLPNQAKSPKINFKGTLPFDTFVKTTPRSNNDLFDYLSSLDNVVRYVDDNIAAGETLSEKDDDFFHKLSDFKIETIIDLREFDKNYQKKCQNNKIKYVSIPLTHVLNDKKDGIFDYKNNGKVKDDFVNQIETLLKYTNKGNAYLGCQYGVDRTNFALVLDYVFNYESSHNAPKIYPSNYATRNALKNKNINLVKKIVKRLSKEQREKLNLPEDFEETIFNERIGKIIKANSAGLTKREMLVLEKKIKFDLMY